MSSWQVFGLAGSLVASASQFDQNQCLLSKLSFLLTAAGQLRILTGFPFGRTHNVRAPRSKNTLSSVQDNVNYYMLWCLWESHLTETRDSIPVVVCRFYGLDRGAILISKILGQSLPVTKRRSCAAS
jgi:hypothetical protein